MNIVDAIILLFILMCTTSGIKRGVIKETVNVVGNLLIIIISFGLMGNIANILYKTLPFLNFGLLGISLSALNILVYQIISFAIIYFLLSVILRVVLVATKVVDKIVNSLVIFRAPSKILGGVVGFIGGYTTIFVILLILALPLADNAYFHTSTLNNFIINKTPILTNLTSNISSATDDIYTLSKTISKDKNKIENSNKYNLKILDIMLKYNVIKVDTVNDLRENNKLDDIANINSVIKKYK